MNDATHLNNYVVHPDNQLLTNFQWQVIVTIYNFQKNRKLKKTNELFLKNINFQFLFYEKIYEIMGVFGGFLSFAL